MNDDFAIAGFSIAKPGQPETANADCWSFAKSEANPFAVFLIVCDGVTSSPNGSGAAKETCNTMTRQFADLAFPIDDAEHWMRKALLESHRCVALKYPGGTGLCTVVAGLAVTDHPLVVAHAGDSPAFCYRNGKLDQLTTDHVQSQARTENGRPLLIAGSPVIDLALTRLVGQKGDFEPEVQSFNTNKGDHLILASDGVPRPAITKWMTNAQVMPTIDKLAKFCKSCGESTQDDATIAIVRLGIPNQVANIHERLCQYAELLPEQREELLIEVDRLYELDPVILLSCIELEDDVNRQIRIVDFAGRNADAISKESWIGYLDQACAQNKLKLAQRLTAVIRKM